LKIQGDKMKKIYTPKISIAMAANDHAKNMLSLEDNKNTLLSLDEYTTGIDPIFQDSKKFKRLPNGGGFVFVTDCSSWAKVVLNGLPLDKFLHTKMTSPTIIGGIGLGENKSSWKPFVVEDSDAIWCEDCGVNLSDPSHTTMIFNNKDDKIVCDACADMAPYQVENKRRREERWNQRRIVDECNGGPYNPVSGECYCALCN
jgi:hypothetical protein